MKELLIKESIVLDAAFDSKYDAIRAAGELLYNNGYVKKEYIDDMLKREDVATVYIGNGLAIPHGIANSEKDILYSGISFMRIPEGVPFGDEKAYFMIGIAGKDGEHLELLAKIAMAFIDPDVIEKLKVAETKEEIFSLLDFL